MRASTEGFRPVAQRPVALHLVGTAAGSTAAPILRPSSRAARSWA